jgi:uncharacterized protein (TIGR02266 family)
MSDPSDSSHQRRHDRQPVSLLVQYRFDTFEDFLAEYSVNLSPGGMFIRSDSPRGLGEMLYLQFALKDGSKLIEGYARVVQVQPEGAPIPGMGVQFVSFDEESTNLIRQICESKPQGK